MKRKPTAAPKADPRRRDGKVHEQPDWRAATLSRVRALIRKSDPGAVEEVKWQKASSPGVPVWSHAGIICTGESYKKAVKLTFARGAELKDPSKLFNAGLEGKVRRAIDIHEGEQIDERAFIALIREAVALNTASKPAKSSAKKPATAKKKASGKKPVLLSGGNPQIPKAEGNAPVQAYIRAIPGWKQAVARRLDTLITRTLPAVRKAVKWNSPFYGVQGQGWFLSFHVFTNYVKVTFFKGTSLRPVPPGGKSNEARWVDVREDGFDEKQMTAWIRQAASIPGWEGGASR